MPHISKELMDKTWREVGALTGERIVRNQKSHRKVQNALTMFAYVKFTDLREDAAGVGIYVYHVVLEAFLRALARPKRVRRAQVERAFGYQNRAEELDPEKSIEQSPEPHALRYVYEALYEGIDDVVLSEDEQEHMFRILQAVIVCLHEGGKRE